MRASDLPEDFELLPGWLSVATAEALLSTLRDEIAWERHRLRLFGREVDAPRLSCWIGDADAAYTYSRVRFQPRPWPPALQRLREELALRGVGRFNSVLANRYRHGRDSMGWHSDDEPELGHEPVIASLSLGAERRFVLRRRGQTRIAHALALPHGSLLLMRGASQRDWQHALPKTARAVGERINLTFRRVIAPAQPG